MIIGFDAKRYFRNFTGLGNYSRHVVQIMAQHYPGHQYRLYSPKLNDHPETRLHEQYANITTHQPQGFMKKPLLRDYWRSAGLSGQLEKEGVDIFHGLSNELPAGINRTRTASVLTIHDLLFIRFPQLYKPADRLIYNYKFKRGCQEADKIIAVSQQTAEDISSFYKIDPLKIDVVYQSCHDMFKKEYSQAEAELVRQKYQLPAEFILNVGTIEKRKNALNILKAMVALGPELSLPIVMIGRATAYKKELDTYIIEHKLQNRVIFLAKLDYHDLPLVYKAASLFVYPSVFEGFGIPIIEALHMGVPVISSTGSCFAEAGGPHSLYASPQNADELAHLISKTLHDTALRQTMITQGFEHVQRFDNKRLAGELMQVYQSVL
jgi:glycosyltransferase involved in cell wall biosynthesis